MKLSVEVEDGDCENKFDNEESVILSEGYEGWKMRVGE